MANSQMTTGKSIAVLAVVLGCFVILWPRLFLPMLQSAFTNKSKASQVSRPEMIHPKLRKTHAQAQSGCREMPYTVDAGIHKMSQDKSNSFGSLGYMMPLYTMAITMLFLYTIIKVVCKNNDEASEENLLKESKLNHIQKDDYIRGECIQNLAVNYLNKSKLNSANITKEDVSCAIQILLQDMKQLKHHLLELEAQRKLLENVKNNCCHSKESYAKNDVFCENELNLSNENSEFGEDIDNTINGDIKSDEESEILGHTTDSEVEE